MHATISIIIIMLCIQFVAYRFFLVRYVSSLENRLVQILLEPVDLTCTCI